MLGTLPRLPLLPDPLRRTRIAHDPSEVSSRGAESGAHAQAVAHIWKGVENLYRGGVHPAIALCIRRNGEVILDRAIGHSHGNGPGDTDQPVLATPATPFCIFSASKALTATVAHVLDERGIVHVGDRVCEYIPEYARHGKEAITIGHVLSHKAGVGALPAGAMDLDRVDDEQYIVDLLCEAKPSSRPGKTLHYHAVSGGFIIAEIVRRATGSDIRTFAREQITAPLGMRWMEYGVAEQDVGAVARNYASGLPALPPLSTLLTRAIGVPVDEIAERANDPRFLRAIVPAGNVVTTANELGRFFELLRCGGELDGVRVMEARTIRRALTEQSYREIDFALGFPFRYSQGFMLGARLLSLYGPDTELAFGHLGFTNILGWADPERALSVALLTSGKPVLYPELLELLGLMRRISGEMPKCRQSAAGLRSAG